MSVTVRGKTKVQWRPDFTLVVDSPDGLSLDSDGEEHDLTATLTQTSNGDPVVGRTISLHTVPAGEAGDGKRFTTDNEGKVTFRVSDLQAESVEYTASLIPRPPTSEVTIEASLTIQWGTGFFLQGFPTDSTSASGSDFGPVQMILSTGPVFNPAAGVSCTVTPIGSIGATDLGGIIDFMLPNHPPGAVVYTLTVPTVVGGVPAFFTHTWT